MITPAKDDATNDDRTNPTLNIKPRTMFAGDCLDILRGFNDECIDLVYLDPPFNSNHNYAAPIGSEAAGAAFKDTWSLSDINLAWHGLIKHDYPGLYALLNAVRKVHSDSMMSYLIYMAVRVVELKRVIKATGSIYLHCDPTAGHYLKLLMDAIFGKENFRNEIIWRIGWVSGFKTQKIGWIRNHDAILYYVRSGEANKRFNKEYIPYPPGYRRRGGSLPTGKGFPIEDTWNCHEGDRLDSIMIKSFSGEKTGYPTQKPLALLKRIIKASSNKGDIVLDPFCGCATACVAAQDEGREWIGIDISEMANKLVRERMRKDLRLFNVGITYRTDIPKRTDLGAVPKYNSIENKKFLYGEQGGYCNGCGTYFEAQHFHIDHIIPRVKGGTDHVSNLQLLCGSCNAIKGARTHEELLVRLTDKGYIKREKGTK